MIREGAPIILRFSAARLFSSVSRPKPTPQYLKRIRQTRTPEPEPKAQGRKPEA